MARTGVEKETEAGQPQVLNRQDRQREGEKRTSFSEFYCYYYFVHVGFGGGAIENLEFFLIISFGF